MEELPALDTLSLGELQALPMWAKTHQAHPNLQLQTRNRWNVTRGTCPHRYCPSEDWIILAFESGSLGSGQ